MDTLEYDIQYNTQNELYSDHPSILVLLINYDAFLH